MKKTKIIAIIAVSFVVFATTLFALAQSQNNNSLFLDSDQDGLTDQEEKVIGTDPFKADTDGDGYSDGKEVESGYNPLKAAPGDKIVVSPQASPSSSETQTVAAANGSTADSSAATSAGSALQDSTDKQSAATDSALLAQMEQSDLLGTDAANDLSSDPNNPNLTNEMIGQLMQRTLDKATADTSFVENPTFTSDDLTQMTQGALETVDISKDLPEVKDSELNILPEITDKDLSAEELKVAQKAEIEKYLAQAAFVFASNSPFPIDQPENLQSQINAESTNFFSAFSSGDITKIDSYAERAQAGIDQIKKIEVPYILKEIHKSTLQLALYTIDLKDEMSLNASDPMKSLAAASSLQAVAQNAMVIETQLSQVLKEYSIDFVNFST